MILFAWQACEIAQVLPAKSNLLPQIRRMRNDMAYLGRIAASVWRLWMELCRVDEISVPQLKFITVQ